MINDTDKKFWVSGNIMISCVVSLMSICIVLCIIVSMMSMRIANEAAMRMENAMSASGIAGLSVDLEKYASSFLNGDALVVVSDAETSYELYKKTFNINISDTEGFINNINIKKYIVYNYFNAENKTDIYYFNQNGCVKKETKYGDVFAPNGIKVKKTSVFAEVEFDLELFGKMKFLCHKQLLTSADKK